MGETSGTFSGQVRLGFDDVFVAKFDFDGNQIWVKQFGTSDADKGRGIFIESSEVYVTGYTSGAFSGQVNLGLSDGFISKFDIDGNQIWVKQFGTSSFDFINDISGDHSGIYVTGETSGTFPSGTSSTIIKYSHQVHKGHQRRNDIKDVNDIMDLKESSRTSGISSTSGTSTSKTSGTSRTIIRDNQGYQGHKGYQGHQRHQERWH